MSETEQKLIVKREPVEGQCSNCGAARLMRYPVLSEGGWYNAVKCQECLNSESREADPVGPVSIASMVLV